MSPSVREVSFDDAEEEWAALLPRCATDTVFVTPWWQRTWWRCFGADYDLRLLAVDDGGARLGLAPLVHRDGVLAFLGDTDLFDYHDFIVPRGNEEPFYEAVLDYLAESGAAALDLKSVPQDSPTLALLPAAAERRGFSLELEREDVAPIAELPATWEEFVTGLGKKYRHELRRKLRRLDAAGEHTLYMCDTDRDLPACLEMFFPLHRASSPEKAAFWNPGRERFFVDVLTEAASRKVLRLAVLELNGERLAACINIDYGSSYLLYNSGYDPAYARLSVGLLNKALTIKWAIASGKRVFDFLRGDERYKYELGAVDRWIYRLTIRR